jgi:hypothetical protein
MTPTPTSHHVLTRPVFTSTTNTNHSIHKNTNNSISNTSELPAPPPPTIPMLGPNHFNFKQRPQTTNYFWQCSIILRRRCKLYGTLIITKMQKMQSYTVHFWESFKVGKISKLWQTKEYQFIELKINARK